MHYSNWFFFHAVIQYRQDTSNFSCETCEGQTQFYCVKNSKICHGIYLMNRVFSFVLSILLDTLSEITILNTYCALHIIKNWMTCLINQPFAHSFYKLQSLIFLKPQLRKLKCKSYAMFKQLRYLSFLTSQMFHKITYIKVISICSDNQNNVTALKDFKGPFHLLLSKLKLQKKSDVQK